MHHFIKFLSISLIALGLVACDNSSDNSANKTPPANSATQPLQVNLLQGKIQFTLPASMSDHSDKLNPPSDNRYIYSDISGSQNVIVLLDPPVGMPVAEQAQRLIALNQSRDPQLKVLSDQPIELSGHVLQKLELLGEENRQPVLSVIITGDIYNQLLTLQISLPAKDLPQAQQIASAIVDSLQLQ